MGDFTGQVGGAFGMSQTKTIAFTSIAFNYLAKARVWAAALRRIHPDWHLVVVMTDSVPAWLNVREEDFDEILTIADLGLTEYPGWMFCHDIEELCTAVKPFAMLGLLQRPGVRNCCYIDPDIVVFDRLDEIIADLDAHAIVLTPHQSEPETSYAGIVDNEIGSLRHGTFNLGFIAANDSQQARAILQWWRARVAQFCLARIDLHLWTDQKWFNLVPVMFEGVAIQRSARFNVAPWNLSRRTITGGWRDGFFVNGERLGFYHFTGFDSGDHETQAKRFAQNYSAVSNLVNWYREECKRRSVGIERRQWAFGYFNSGSRISRTDRLIYRYRVDLQQAYPNPFDDRAAPSFFDWLRGQGTIEYSELKDFAEDNNADLPNLPQVSWLRHFPPPIINSPLDVSVMHSARDNQRSGGNLAPASKNFRRLQAIRDPVLRKILMRRVIEVWRQGGLRGVLSKFFS